MSIGEALLMILLGVFALFALVAAGTVWVLCLLRDEDEEEP